MSALPPGQYEIKTFPRFGLRHFARRFPLAATTPLLHIVGDIEQPLDLTEELRELPRVEQTSDFHCVTTWSCRALRWSGYRFRDFYERIVIPYARPSGDIAFASFRCRDGYSVSLPLADLLADDVLLADRLHDEPLPLAHGAPLRLVAPAHYGYKNPKYLWEIEFRRDGAWLPSPVFPFRFMDHPRARVALEERGWRVPGWLLRFIYRPLVRPTIREFQAAIRTKAGS